MLRKFRGLSAGTRNGTHESFSLGIFQVNIEINFHFKNDYNYILNFDVKYFCYAI